MPPQDIYTDMDRPETPVNKTHENGDHTNTKMMISASDNSSFISDLE